MLSALLLSWGCTKPENVDSGRSDSGVVDSYDSGADTGESPDAVTISVTLDVDVAWVVVVGDEEDEWDYVAPSEFPAGSVLVDEVDPGTWFLLAASPERDRCAATAPEDLAAGDHMSWTVSEFTGDYDHEVDFFACGAR